MSDLRIFRPLEFLVGGLACGGALFFVTLFLLRGMPFTAALPFALIGLAVGTVSSTTGVALGRWWLIRRNEGRTKPDAEQATAADGEDGAAE